MVVIVVQYVLSFVGRRFCGVLLGMGTRANVGWSVDRSAGGQTICPYNKRYDVKKSNRCVYF